MLQLTSLVTTAVLARLLTTADFGIVAITVVVLTMFELITSVGLAGTIIRREPLTEEVKSTFFWASLILGLAVAAFVVAFAVPAASLAGEPAAAPLVALAAVTIPLNLTGRIPAALLSRAFRFKALATIEIGGSLVQAVVAVSLAFMGLGAASVVIGQICRSTIMLSSWFLTSRFMPRFTFNRHVLGEELSFNFGLLGADLVSYANKNADYWFVGNTLGAGPLGLYYVAYVIPNLLRRRITLIGHEVMYPVVSRIQVDLPRIESAFLRVARMVTYLVVPAMLGLAVVADLAVVVGFGPAWEGAIGPLRFIAVAAAVTSMTVMANPVFAALGQPRILILNGLIALMVLGAGLALSLTMGTITAVAAAVLAAAVADGIAILIRMRSLVGLQIGRYLVSVLPFVSSAVVMAALVVGLRISVLGHLHPIGEAITSVLVGVAAYLLIGEVFMSSSFREQRRVVRSLVVPSST